MEVTVKNTALRGSIKLPPSKSDAHRALIIAAISEAPVRILLESTNEDIEATLGCLAALGAGVRRDSGSITITPISGPAVSPLLDCGESGSTQRFLLPVAAAVAVNPCFTGRGRLPERPLEPLLHAMAENGVTASSARLPLTLSGRLRKGKFLLPGDISSQFISGLLMANHALGGGCELELSSPLESSGYVEMTMRTLEQFIGGRVEEYKTEGDWSSAAFFLVANALGGAVEIDGLPENSRQPDRAIAALCRELPEELDVSPFPDLFPILAVLACGRRGKTRLSGAGRLRLKESDRIMSTAKFITELGGEVSEGETHLDIFGTGRLRGGRTDSAGDHRIAMSAAIAAGICDSPVTIGNAAVAAKSYPAFWDEIRKLTGVN